MSFIILGINENGKPFVNISEQNTNYVRTVREYKGKSKLIIPDDFVILDIETTGLDPNYDSIIELGAIKVLNGKIVDTYNSLAKPLDEIDSFITDLTGITNDMVTNAPELKDALPEFLDFVGDSYIMGHNVNFDINFIYDNCLNLLNKPFTNDFVDTMRLSRKLFTQFDSHRLKKLVKNLKLDGNVSHRAIADCECVYNLYLYIKQYMQDNNVEFNILKKKKSAVASEITSNHDNFDIDHPIYGKICIFTGTLEHFTRKEAMQVVADLGGVNGDGVTSKTNFLILGNNDYCSTIKDGKSNKQKKAEAYILKGQDIQILSENTFYDMISS